MRSLALRITSMISMNSGAEDDQNDGYNEYKGIVAVNVTTHHISSCRSMMFENNYANAKIFTAKIMMTMYIKLY